MRPEQESSATRDQTDQVREQEHQNRLARFVQTAFAPGATSQRESSRDNERLIQDNVLPDTRIIEARADRGGRTPDRTTEGRSNRPEAQRHSHEEEIIVPNASQRFRRELRNNEAHVRSQLPAHVRDALRDTTVDPVRSIRDRHEGFPINGRFDPETNNIKIAEHRLGEAGSDAILRHEFGHAYDLKDKNNPISADRRFRSLVDQATERDPELRQIRKENPEAYYEEVFADLFASSVGSRSGDLAIAGLDRRMRAARDWVRRRVHGN